MNALKLLPAAVLLSIISGPVANAQLEQPFSSPAGAPVVLLLVRQEFQFGKESARQRLSASISRACDQIKVPNMWIDLQSLTGKPEALSFDPFDSFTQIDDAFAAWPQIFASRPDLSGLQEELRALETSERTIIATRRSDLSYQASTIELSKARFMRVLEVRVRPGHEDEFVEAFKILRAAYFKIRADLPWVVYQANVGIQTPTFLAFVPMRALSQNDDLFSWRGLLREAEGEAGANRIAQVARDAYISSESNLYAISPSTSHVTREFAAGDPGFWSLSPAASLLPGQSRDSGVELSTRGSKILSGDVVKE